MKIYDEKTVQDFKERVEKLLSEHQEKEAKGVKVHKMLISKEVVDRDWEIVKLDWLDTKRYKKNPVVLIDHRYTIDSIVGKTKKIYQEGKKLYADFVFADTEKAKLIEEMYEEGFINASSIGFMAQKRAEDNRKVIEESELLEWSLVVAWSNREALKEKNIDLYNKIDKSGLLDVQHKDCDGNEEITLEKVFEEIKELKMLMKSFAEDKAKEIEIEVASEEAKAKKEALQIVNRATALALEKLKTL